jgi:two-component sensor histidine kinase
MEEFREAFAGRIQTLARIHGSLAGRRQEGLPVGELVELVVGPYRHQTDRVRIDCDSTFVPADLVRSLGLALHELATNAAKYGALSNAAGQVAISARTAVDDGGRLRINWSEQGGPPTGEPARRGFGTRLIEEALAHEAGGHATLRFPADGFRCDIDVPLGRPT